MARDAHMEAARHHLEAASKHLAAVGSYNDGDPDEAMQHSHEARVASELADNMSIEAHRQTIVSLVSAGD
jgi:hypothetical protein